MNLKLEKFCPEDFALYFLLVNDIRVMQMITERILEPNEAQDDFIKILENNRLHECFGSYKILSAETNTYIGFAKLEIKETNSEEAELGYMILPEYWGQGIAGQVSASLVETAKKQQQLTKLVAIIDPKNAASRKILINNEFRTREFIDFDGLPGEILELNLR